MTIIFGTGYLAKQILFYEYELEIKFFIDNDVKKIGTQFAGYEIKAPEALVGAEYNQVVLASDKYAFEMRKQLLDMGVESDKIICYWELDMFDKNNVELELPQEEILFENVRVRTREDYNSLEYANSYIQMETVISKMVSKSPKKRIYYPGKCQVCRKNVNFLVDNLYSAGPLKINFRERMVCPFCNLNNRQRKIAELILNRIPKDGIIYLTEQITPMYHVFKTHFDNVIGSEFLGTDLSGGTINDKGIRHEDVTQLSFETDSMDCVVSCDVLEHVSDIEKALCEIYRVLKKGGQFYATFPMIFNAEHTVKRANLIEDRIEFLCEPVYHGNPVSNEGSLVFYDYGFDFMDMVKDSGFKDAYFMPFYSIQNGNIGVRSNFIFVAEK